MTDHDAFGRGGRAGGILKKRQIPAANLRGGPERLGISRKRVCGQKSHLSQCVRIFQPLLYFGTSFFKGTDVLGPGIVKNRLNTGKMAFVTRRIGRNRHCSGIQTAKKRGDKLQPRRIEQQYPFPASVMLLKQGANGSRLPVQRSVCHHPVFFVLISYKCIEYVVSLLLRPFLSKFPQC